MPAKRIPRRSLFIPPPASLVNIWIRSRRLHLLRSVGSAADLGRIPSVLLSFGCNSGWVFRVPWGSAPTQCHAGLLLLGEHRAAEGSQHVWVMGKGVGGVRNPAARKRRSSPNRVAFCFRTEPLLLFGWSSIPTFPHAPRRALRGEG